MSLREPAMVSKGVTASRTFMSAHRSTSGKRRPHKRANQPLHIGESGAVDCPEQDDGPNQPVQIFMLPKGELPIRQGRIGWSNDAMETS